MSSNLLDLLGVEPDEFEWTDLSLCGEMDTELFYDLYEKDAEIAKATDETCLHCPVQQTCFFKGQDGQWGVWGGVFWNGSGRPDENRNKHKTDEVWKRIRERVS